MNSNGFHIIGYGGMGQIRKKIAEKNGFKCLSIYDTEKGYIEFPDVIEDEFVFICTPPSYHKKYVDYFKNRGANVFCEKPFTEKGVFTGWSHRYHREISLFREHRYSFLEINWIRNKGIPAGWMSYNETDDKSEMKNTVWSDLGVHLADMACYITRSDGVFLSKNDFDFSKGNIEYKAPWWGFGKWNYRSMDNSVAVIQNRETLSVIRVAWASPESDFFSIKGYTVDGTLVQHKINPMENVFEQETLDFLNGKKQETYYVL